MAGQMSHAPARPGAWLALALLVLPFDARADEEPPPVQSETVYTTVVTAPTPLQGSKLPLDRVAANVQVASGEEVAANGGPDLADYLNTTMGSVHVNEVQGNPLQSDLA